MTSPDRFSTDKTYSPSTIHRLQEQSKEAAALEAHAGTKAIMDAAGNSFFLNILSGFFSIGEAIGDFIDSLANALFGRYNGDHPTLEAIESWTAENTGNWGPVIEDYGQQLDRKVEAWAVPTVSPLSQTINRQADPVFQLSDLLSPSFRGRYYDEGETGTATRYLDTANGDVTWSMGSGAASTTDVHFAFITPAINRKYERLNFMVDAVTSPRPMDVAIYVLDEDKVLTLQVLQTNAGAALPTAQAVATVEFSPWIATQGSYVAIMWRQYGTGSTRRLLGMYDSPRPLSNQFFPPRLAGTMSGAANPFPQTIDGQAALNFAGSMFVPYAELSEKTGELRQHFTDNFNRRGYLDRPWAKLTGQAPWADSTSAGVLQALVVFDGPRIALYDQPMSSERVHVEVQMTGPLGPQGVTWFAVRTTNTSLNGAGIFITNGTISLRSWSNAANAEAIRGAATTVVSVNHTLEAWDLITCDYDNGTFKVDLNGNTIITSPGHSYGKQFRFMGIGFDRISGDSPPRMAQWRAWDIEDA